LANFNGRNKNSNLNNGKTYLYSIRHKFSLNKYWAIRKAFGLKIFIKRKNIDKRRVKIVKETFDKRQYIKFKAKLLDNNINNNNGINNNEAV